jgi:hypothetical protein
VRQRSVTLLRAGEREAAESRSSGSVRVKRLCLANGDYFDEVIAVCSDLEQAINDGGFIRILDGGKDIRVNTEFIVSFEVD